VTLGKAGACAAIPAAMRAHPLAQGIQKWGAMAIEYLAQDNPKNKVRMF
jgi:hypothetical protein